MPAPYGSPAIEHSAPCSRTELAVSMGGPPSAVGQAAMTTSRRVRPGPPPLKPPVGSWCQAGGEPGGGGCALVAETVVQPPIAPLPELDGARHEHVPAPVRRARHRAAAHGRGEL